MRIAMGFLAWFRADSANSFLMRQALGYYAENPVPYSDEPWIAELENSTAIGLRPDIS